MDTRSGRHRPQTRATRRVISKIRRRLQCTPRTRQVALIPSPNTVLPLSPVHLNLEPRSVPAAPRVVMHRTPAADNVGFWPRAVAFLVDCMILGVATDIIRALLAVAAPAPEAADGAMVGSPGPMTTIRALAMVLYVVLMNGAYGATLGKMMLGYRVVNVDGSPIGYVVAFIRFWLMYVLAGFTLCLSVLSVAADEEHRGWHDKIMGTRVVHNRPQRDRAAQQSRRWASPAGLRR